MRELACSKSDTPAEHLIVFPTVRKIVDASCRYVSDDHKTAPGSAPELDNLIPTGKVCSFLNTVPDPSPKTIEVPVPTLEIRHHWRALISMTSWKLVEDSADAHCRAWKSRECRGDRVGRTRCGRLLTW